MLHSKTTNYNKSNGHRDMLLTDLQQRDKGVRINHAVATPAAPASVWTMHRPYWPHRPYTVYMAVLYTKHRADKLSKMLAKSMHGPHRLA